MSWVTTVVVALPSDFIREDVTYVGHVLLDAHSRTRCARIRRPADPDYAFHPVSNDEADGGKNTHNSIFWLGLNFADMDEIIKILDADPKCHGAWIWWQSEANEDPTTHLVAP